MNFSERISALGPDAEVKQMQLRSEPGLIRCMACRAARSTMRAEREWDIESFEDMMRLSPLDLARASRSVWPTISAARQWSGKASALSIVVPILERQNRLPTALPIAICNLFFLNHSPRSDLV
jgi:hypothetical protein